MMLGSHVKKAQTISFVERGFERLGLGHRTVVRVGSDQWILSEESGELYTLLILLVSRTPWLGGRVSPPPPFSHWLSYPFIRAFTLLPASTYKLNFLGLKTCPVSPYLEWLGVGRKSWRVWSCQVQNALLQYWQPFTCAVSALWSLFLLGAFMACRAGVHPRPFP